MNPFGSRRYGQSRGGRLSPLAIVAIVAAVALVLTVIVGNLLRLWVDDETYEKLKNGKDRDDPVSYRTDVPDVVLYPFRISDSTDDLFDRPGISVTINDSSGAMNYSSAVASYQKLPVNSRADLQSKMPEISVSASYVSGVYYSRAWSAESPELFYAMAVDECAVLREFLRAGGSEILLVGLPTTPDFLPAVLDYVRMVKSVAESSAVGVAVPLSDAAADQGWEIIGSLLDACDFCALDCSDLLLDGTSPQDALASTDFFRTQYSMRLLLRKSQTTLASAAEDYPITNLQVYD